MLRAPARRRFAFLGATMAATLFALPASLSAQAPDRMEQIVSAEAEAKTFMGAVLVAQDGEVLLDQAWGSADLEWNIDNTTSTKFRIGSVTKQFTAVLILLLQERGALDLDDPISQHLEDTPATWSAITVRNLLRHTSGIPNVTALDDFGTFKYLPTTQDALIARFSGLPLEFEPGSQWKYSNSGYVLLSRIVENTSGEDYEAFLRANILDPLEMRETGLDRSSAILPRRAEGYSPSQNGIVNADYVNMGIPTGAGALYSTTGDLLKWQRGLFGGQVLSSESLAEYTNPADFDAVNGAKYAHGVLIQADEDGRAIWHGGGIEGFNAWLGYDPDNKTTVAVLANLNGGTAMKLGQQLMKAARGREIVLSSEREEVAVEPAKLAEYEGVYALAPTFKITISREGDALMAQATNQNAFEIFPEGPDRFFYKVVDAQIRFDRDEAGAISGLTLFQNGQELPGTRE